MNVRKRVGPSGWKLLCQAPLTMWLGVSAVDTFTGSLRKEAKAFDVALARGRRHFDGNPLVKAVVAHARKPSRAQQRGISGATPKALLSRLQKVSKVLDRHADPRDAEEFRRFLLDVGWTVAKASSESPLGGFAVSEAEERFLYDADRALSSDGHIADVA
jgi:hypothetical protein